MKRNIIVFIMILSLSMMMLSGCNSKANSIGETNSNKNSNKPTIAVSIVPEKAFVEAVCKDLVNVVVMVPPGSSPENYEPTPQEIQKFSSSDIYFSIGVPTEKNNIIPNVSKNTKVVDLAQIVANTYPDLKIGDERDPHIWLSPKRASVMVQAIADEISKIDEKNKDTYQANAKDYITKINDVDKEIKDALSKVENKKFIVYHPAFGYLADDYDLKMYALEEEGKESTADNLKKMINLAKKEKIKVIFYQAEISSSQAQSFAEEIGGKSVMLSPLAEDYIGNLKTMVKAIGDIKK